MPTIQKLSSEIESFMPSRQQVEKNQVSGRCLKATTFIWLKKICEICLPYCGMANVVEDKNNKTSAKQVFILLVFLEKWLQDFLKLSASVQETPEAPSLLRWILNFSRFYAFLYLVVLEDKWIFWNAFFNI